MNTAAFYDLDGTLLRGNVLAHYIYYARTEPTPAGRAKRLLETAVKAPFWVAIDWFDRKMFNEHFYASYAGLSEDRLAVLGQELFDTTLKKKIFPGAPELVAGDRKAGHITVLVTGALEFVAEPVARHFGFDHWVATGLEYGPDGVATGRLRPPVIAGPEKVRWIRKFCVEHDVDLEACRAYADDIADLPFLSLVGKPTAVNPDMRLGTVARSHGWRILNLDGRTDVRHRIENAEERVGAFVHDAQRAVADGGVTLQRGFKRFRRLARDLARGRGATEAPPVETSLAATDADEPEHETTG